MLNRANGRSGPSPRAGCRRWWAALAGIVVAPIALIGCGSGSGSGSGKKAAGPPPATTVPATTTTSTTIPLVSRIVAIGVRAAVSQPPFYPQVTVMSVSCGVLPKGGRFVRINLPASTAAPAKSVLTKPTAVMVVTGGAILIDPRYTNKVLYSELMPSITTAKQGAFVLTMESLAKFGADGLAVPAGAVQVNGDYACPPADAPFPGT